MNFQSLIDEFVGSSPKVGGSRAGGGINVTGLAGGAAAAGIAGLLLGSKTGRKMATGALKYGGVAAIGALAYKAWQSHQQAGAEGTAQPVPGGAADRFLPNCDTADGQDRLARTLTRARVSAANADGHIDAREHRRILDAIEAFGLSSADTSFLIAELSRPASAETVAAGATTPETAADVYLAAVLVSDTADPKSRQYLDDLARHLNLGPALKAQLERSGSDV